MSPLQHSGLPMALVALLISNGLFQTVEAHAACTNSTWARFVACQEPIRADFAATRLELAANVSAMPESATSLTHDFWCVYMPSIYTQSKACIPHCHANAEFDDGARNVTAWLQGLDYVQNANASGCNATIDIKITHFNVTGAPTSTAMTTSYNAVGLWALMMTVLALAFV